MIAGLRPWLSRALGVLWRVACLTQVIASVIAANDMRAPILLAADLFAATTIDLRWTTPRDERGGYVVEYINQPDDAFVVLDVLPPEQTTFRHADLMEETRFAYRIRAYYGPTSKPVTVVAGEAPDSVSEGSEEPRTAAAADCGTRALRQVRDAELTFGLTTALRSPRVVDLEWRDVTADEDGYMVEAAKANEPWRVVAMLPPNTISLQLSALPANAESRFRIRPYCFGPPSNLAERTTRQPRTAKPGSS